MSGLITASQLNRYCGAARLLNKERVRTPEQQAAMDKGTAFHEAVEKYYTTDETVSWSSWSRSEEVGAWLYALISAWAPPSTVKFEWALGLGPQGQYVPVKEPEPHVYVGEGDVALLTAGRADVVWTEGDVVVVADFKTGKSPVEAPATNLQLWALGLAAAGATGAAAVRVGVYYARKGKWVWYPEEGQAPVPLDSSEAADRYADVEAAATIGDEPRVGWWCRRCWERGHCKAYKEAA